MNQNNWRKSGRHGMGHHGVSRTQMQGNNGIPRRDGTRVESLKTQSIDVMRDLKDKQHQVMENNTMEKLLKCLDHEILIALTNSSNGFNEALNSDDSDPKNHELILNKLEMIARCCQCESAPSYILQLLNMVNSSALIQHDYLNNFLLNVTMNDQISVENYSKGIENTLSIIEAFLFKMPHSDFVRKVKLTFLTLNDLINRQSEVLTNEIRTSISELGNLYKEILDSQSCSNMVAASGDGTEWVADRACPADNFRDLSVVPSISDIHLDADTFLRANKLKGKFEDLEHYLDVQYRLLREDFVYPLRIGILSYLDVVNGRVPKDTKLTDVTIYENVHVLGAVCTGEVIAYRLQFDITKTRTWNWEHSKHLIYGSLVALSNDNFETMHICTVVNRNTTDLTKGNVEVKFENESMQFSLIGSAFTFTMAETSAYYEPYRHVLTALREITPFNLPFQEYIVKCRKDIEAPRYLLQEDEVCFDFSPLLENGSKDVQHKTKTSVKKSYDFSGSDNSSSDDSSIEDAKEEFNVPVLELEKWPSASQLKLDDSQYSSLQHCLTKEFALVQGPPGTGKTFLGLKVARLLLHNWKRWHQHCVDNDNDAPILIVCYTNHALDQFLEGIFQIADNNIVRVGGRSQSELLENCVLHRIRSDMKENRNVPMILHQTFRELRSEMEGLEKDINRTTLIIENINCHIMQYSILRRVMSNRHVKQFEFYYKSTDDPLTTWLLEKCFGGKDSGKLQDNKSYKKLKEGEDAINVDRDEIEKSRRIEDYADANDFQKRKAKERQELIKEVKDRYFNTEAHQTKQAEKCKENEFNWDTLKADKVKKKKERKFRLLKLIQAFKYIQPMTGEECSKIADISILQAFERQRLYKYWTEVYKKNLHERTENTKEKHQLLSQQLQEARHQLDKEIIKRAKVVGMTTTAAARYHLVLQEIQPQIVIVEEAAEVLEAHVVTALNRNCKHFILIGDHQQLRPNPTVYELAKKYNLDLSLFERMVNNNIPIKTLSLQHRMRPSISKLMVPFYSDLQDDVSVTQYPEVKGINHSLYFVNHKHHEDHHEELQSKQNSFEADYASRLCKYLILQEYKPSQITILTPYSGQLLQLKTVFRKAAITDVRITVIDNFQGEENDIIILSLVRSNKQGKLGFLKIDNRVCVALSRAKIGLYVIGNIDFLANHSKIWTQIKTIALEEGTVSSALPLVCQQHPKKRIDASSSEDFDEAPEGGCTHPCKVRLDCGHVCPLACHSYDAAHENVTCYKPCTKYLCEDHICPKVCSEMCGQCMVSVKKIVKHCNHEFFMPCSKDPETWLCTKSCHKELECGHKCSGTCGGCHRNPAHETCIVKVTRKLPSCGHDCEMDCHISPTRSLCKEPCGTELKCGHICTGTCGGCHRNPAHETCIVKVTRKLPSCGHNCEMNCHISPTRSICKEPCGTELKCGHTCTGTCGNCYQGLHRKCTRLCNQTLICGHICNALCHQVCPPCQEECFFQCAHKMCLKKCGEPCLPCREPCQWRCQHYECSKLCDEPCDRPKCIVPCPLKLPCGHPCIGLCGEACPKLCRVCDRKLVMSNIFGKQDCATAIFVSLGCGDIVEVEEMDKWMETNQLANHAIALVRCPRCGHPIRETSRYNSQIKPVLSDIAEIKKISFKCPSAELESHALKLRSDCHSSMLIELNERVASLLRNGRLASLVSEREYATLHNLITFSVENLRLLKHRLLLPHPVDVDIFEFCRLFHRKLRKVLHLWMGCSGISEGEMLEFCQKLKRLKMGLLFARVKRMVNNNAATVLNKPGMTDAMRRCDNLEKVLRSEEPYDVQTMQRCREDLHSINDMLSLDLPIDIELGMDIEIKREKKMWDGHWFKCPRGHIYASIECGGAMDGTCLKCEVELKVTEQLINNMT